MDSLVIGLVALVVVIFVVGVVVGLALSRHCRLLLLRAWSRRTEQFPLEEIQIATEAFQAKQLVGEQAQGLPLPIGIHARAVSRERLAPDGGQVAAAAKRATSVEVGEIYRTASAFSIYLDEMENRPHINRLMSMPSMTDPQRIIDANHINPNIEVHMDEIDLQEQVGKGGFGAVYKGTWRGAVVAVKYAVCNVEDVESLEQSIREVVLSKKMSHPNVVQTYAWTVLAGAEAAGAAAMEDEADVVKAALAKTNNPASLATAVDLVGGLGKKAGPCLPAPSSASTLRAKSQDLSEQVRQTDDSEAKLLAGDSTQAWLHSEQQQISHQAVPSEPGHVESPFANFDPPITFSKVQCLGDEPGRSTQKRQGPVENISPMFERMLLESEQGHPLGNGDDASVKRRLDMGCNDGGPVGAGPSMGSGEDECEPLSIDELLFRSRGSEGRPSEAEGASSEGEHGGSISNASPAAVGLRVALPDGAPVLQQVVSSTFSDISGCMLSPAVGGAVSTPAGPRCHVGVCPALPRSYLSRTSSLGSRSGAQTPQRTLRARTPDSFNRHAAPGTSLFDGTEATPQHTRQGRLGGEHGAHLPPRARRRITFGPAAEAFEQLQWPSAGGEGRGAPGRRRQTEHGTGSRLGHRLEPINRRRSRSLSPSRGTPPWFKQEDEANRETPERAENRSLPDWAVSQSPADTDALLAGHTPSTTLQLQRSARGGRPDGTPETTLADLELDVAARTLSAHSCASFNSEEGFGSPMAGKHRRRNSINMDDYDGNGPGAMMVVVMEFCDLQSLHRAITKKVFKPHGKFSKQATYRALLRTAQEVAKGMDYIHSFGIVHGDLKPGNVLLKTHRIDRRGYIAKVSDFGLSRPANADGDTSGRGLGTIAYTAPETFQSQCVDKASDIYAFGILLWEMHHCREAFEGLMEGQICVGVCDGSLRPEFDEECPADFRELTARCWAQNPETRPSFKDIVTQLTEIEVQFRKLCHMLKPHAGMRTRRTQQSPQRRQPGLSGAPRPLARSGSECID